MHLNLGKKFYIQRDRNKRLAVKYRGVGGVYVVGNLEAGYYKIGWTENIQKRVKALNSSAPWPMELVAAFPCPDRVRFESEQYLHNRFAHKATNTEWFRLDREDIEAILKLQELPDSSGSPKSDSE